MQGAQGRRSSPHEYEGRSSTYAPAAVSSTGEWQELVDPKSNRSYWWNKVTNKTQWKPPVQAASSSADRVGSDSTEELENGWTKQWDSGSKKEYFWNMFTDKSVWDRPDIHVPLKVPEGWTKEYDPQTKRHYFWHKQTQRSQWIVPPR